jgi:hypothetical protein
MTQFSNSASQTGSAPRGGATDGLSRLLQEMQGLRDLMPGVADGPQIGQSATSGRHNA